MISIYFVLEHNKQISPALIPGWGFISDEANAEMVKQTTLNDGRVYIFAKVFPDARSMSYNGFIMRKDWLDKLNLDLPDNIADWEAALTAIKTGDPNGNGENDEIPFVPEGVNHIRQFATAWGVRSGLYPDLETGEITFGQLHEEYKDFLMICRNQMPGRMGFEIFNCRIQPQQFEAVFE